MKIPYGRQFIDNRDILNVAECFKKEPYNSRSFN